MPDAMTPLGSLMLLVENEMAELPLRTYPMLSLISKRDSFQRNIKWTANVGGAAVGGRATNAANAISASESVRHPLELPIATRTMGHRFDVLRTDIIEARRTAPEAMANLFQDKIREGLEEMLTALNALLYTGTGTSGDHGIFGLNYVATSNTYAGLATATAADWNAYVNAGAGDPAVARNLTRVLMGKMNSEASLRGAQWDAIFTHPEIIEKYDQLFADQASTSVNVAPMGFVDLAFSGYTYKGRPLIGDPGCPPGKMFWVNSSRVNLYTFNLTGSAVQSVQSDPTKTQGLNLSISEIRNENPDVLSFELSIKPQLKVMNRRKDIMLLNDLVQA